jgi:hypothetical protein
MIQNGLLKVSDISPPCGGLTAAMLLFRVSYTVPWTFSCIARRPVNTTLDGGKRAPYRDHIA